MKTLARSAYLETEVGALSELPRAGSSLENPYAFDAAAKELKAMASKGLVRIVEERSETLGDDELIRSLKFERLR
jgi:hypothetical protein